MDSTNNFEKTVYHSTSSEELEKIYNKEMVSSIKNEIILRALKEIKLEQLDNKAIQKALIAVQISHHIDLPSNKLLGLEDFDISKINLSYLEKKQLKVLVVEELKKKMSYPLFSIDQDKSREVLIQNVKERKELTEKLAELKNKQLKLTNECAQIRVGPNQINSVDKILQDSTMNEVTLKGFKNTLLQNLKDDIYVRASKQVENNIDLLIEKQADK